MLETGGYEYYIKYRKGNHEIRKILNDDDEYEVVYTGSYEACIKKMAKIREDNYEYDYDL